MKLQSMRLRRPSNFSQISVKPTWRKVTRSITEIEDYAGAISHSKRPENFRLATVRFLEALAFVCRRLGEWQRSLNYFRQATQLDPRDAALLSSEAETFFMLRQYPAALKACDQILDILPDNSTALAIKVQVYQAQGDERRPPRCCRVCLLMRARNYSTVQTNQWAYERRYTEGIAGLQGGSGKTRSRHNRNTIKSSSNPTLHGSSSSPARPLPHVAHGSTFETGDGGFAPQ